MLSTCHGRVRARLCCPESGKRRLVIFGKNDQEEKQVRKNRLPFQFPKELLKAHERTYNCHVATLSMPLP